MLIKTKVFKIRMAHIHEKIDFTVETFIVYKDKVLLRKHDKYGIWLGVGGHIELDEDPNLAAVREPKEEVGLEVILLDERNLYNANGRPGKEYVELIPPTFLNRHRINATHEHITLMYIATAKTDKLTLSETEKSPACLWMTAEDVHKHPEIDASVKMYAIEAIQRVKRYQLAMMTTT